MILQVRTFWRDVIGDDGLLHIIQYVTVEMLTITSWIVSMNDEEMTTFVEEMDVTYARM